MNSEPITEQQWLGNEQRTGKDHMTVTEILNSRGSLEAAAAVTDALEGAVFAEADALADMKRAFRPFRSAFWSTAEKEWEYTYPRAGVRFRADGRAQLRIWLDPTLPDPVQGGACETLAEACNLGAMIVHFARQASA
jgi:hypothetical protein